MPYCCASSMEKSRPVTIISMARLLPTMRTKRCVPPVHPASNYGQAADVLLDNPRIGEHVAPADVERAAKAAESVPGD